MPVDTSVKSHRHRAEGFDDHTPADRDADKLDNTANFGRSPRDIPRRPPRKFAPQLIETAKRTRKAGDTRPAILASDKTEATPVPALSSFRESRLRSPLMSPGNIDCDNLRDVLEARRLGIPISTRESSMSSSRSHSFRVPDLEPIDSSQSEESGPPSLSSSPSGSSDQSFMYKHATRLRESVDDRSSGYLLQVAARAAEKQLREQALAAFPNDDEHEPVDHFIDRDVDESRLGSRSRPSESSFVQVNWELREMQAHRERLSQQRKNEKQATEQARLETDGASRGPWGDPTAALFAGIPRDREMEGMQKGARPPMLGGDIKFPRCSSPEPARFDVTQGSEALRDSMCYLTEQSQAQEEDHDGLWEQKAHSCQKGPLWSNPGSRQPSHGGLWHGCCINTSSSSLGGRSGLMTPKTGIGNLHDTPNSSPHPDTASAFLAPPKTDFTGLDEKLKIEISIEEEFNDDFVTQVYNYLSLGYPSIARDYDAELSKISRIPVSELRQDDNLTATRGYIRLGEDDACEVGEENCMRWRALRLYVYEWARQQPRMISRAHALGGFGVEAAARRGSWAI